MSGYHNGVCIKKGEHNYDAHNGSRTGGGSQIPPPPAAPRPRGGEASSSPRGGLVPGAKAPGASRPRPSGRGRNIHSGVHPGGRPESPGEPAGGALLSTPAGGEMSARMSPPSFIFSN